MDTFSRAIDHKTGFAVGGFAGRGDAVDAAHGSFLACIAYYKGAFHGLPYVRISTGNTGNERTRRVVLAVRY